MGKTFAQPQVLEKPLVPLEVEKYVPGEIIVKFKPGVRDEVISELNRRLGTSVLYTSPFAGFKRLKIPKGKTVEEMVNIYKRNPNVEYAEPNFIVYAFMVPNDEYYFYQWHLDNPEYGGINMEAAWDISTGGFGVTVAIIDTGVTAGTDLADTCFVLGHDFVNGDDDPSDDNGHGTHVAGTIAQSTNNGIGVAGVAFNACLMPVKVLDQNGSGTEADVADGISWAVDHEANIINLSLGGPDDSQTLRSAIADAYEKGVTIVAAAGNDGSDTLSYPAAYDAYVIAVGATRYDETLADYSNYGSNLDLVAPGGDLYNGVLQQTFQRICLLPGLFCIDLWDYWFMAGTSCACPHVSGVAALVIANGNADANGDGVTSPYEVRVALQETAECLGEEECPNDTYGWGLIDAAAALGYTPGPVPNQPPVADADGPYTEDEDSPITFDGLGSYDPDGDLLIYRWDFGDGTQVTVNTPTTTHTYTTGQAGKSETYTVTLVVNDGKADSGSATTTATVTGVNDLPIADADGPYSGQVGEEITFDASGSSDEEGISSYTWGFGDGTQVTVDTPTTTHIYAAGGNYDITLTVTDTNGATATDTTTAEVTEATTNTMHVEDIDMRPGGHISRGRWTWYKALATVPILDSSGNPVAGATVEGYWSGAYSGNVSEITSTNGEVTFETKWVKGGGEFTFTVDGVTKKDWSYDSSANVETSDSITVP